MGETNTIMGLFAITLLFTLAAVAHAGDSSLCQYSVIDPSTDKTYYYDMCAFQFPDNATQLFLKGEEAGGSWVAYLNIFGSASAVGCKEETPACQVIGDGKTFYTMGNTLKLSPYFDPARPDVLIYDGGVSVSILGGPLLCKGRTTARQSYLWLKCDPTVTTMPVAPIQIREVNPANPTVMTPCQYYFAPIAHAAFCPNPPPVSSNSQVNTLKVAFTAELAVTLVTGSNATVPVGFACTPVLGPCSSAAYTCTGQVSNGTSIVVDAIQVTLVADNASLVYKSTDPSVDCATDQSFGFFSTSGDATWELEEGNVAEGIINGAVVASVMP